MWYKVLLKGKDGKFLTSNTYIDDSLLHTAEDVNKILTDRFGKFYNWFGAKYEHQVDEYKFDTSINFNNDDFKNDFKNLGIFKEKLDKSINQKENAIEYCEQNYPKMCAEFKSIQQKQYELLCKKQMDYGPGNIAVGTQLKDDKEIMASLKAIIVRANDKMQRLVNLILINNREPSNESVEDTFMDLAVYSTIAMVVKNGKWGK